MKRRAALQTFLQTLAVQKKEEDEVAAQVDISTVPVEALKLPEFGELPDKCPRNVTLECACCGVDIIKSAMFGKEVGPKEGDPRDKDTVLECPPRSATVTQFDVCEHVLCSVCGPRHLRARMNCVSQDCCLVPDSYQVLGFDIVPGQEAFISWFVSVRARQVAVVLRGADGVLAKDDKELPVSCVACGDSRVGDRFPLARCKDCSALIHITCLPCAGPRLYISPDEVGARYPTNGRQFVITCDVCSFGGTFDGGLSGIKLPYPSVDRLACLFNSVNCVSSRMRCIQRITCASCREVVLHEPHACAASGCKWVGHSSCMTRCSKCTSLMCDTHCDVPVYGKPGTSVCFVCKGLHVSLRLTKTKAVVRGGRIFQKQVEVVPEEEDADYVPATRSTVDSPVDGSSSSDDDDVDSVDSGLAGAGAGAGAGFNSDEEEIVYDTDAEQMEELEERLAEWDYEGADSDEDDRKTKDAARQSAFLKYGDVCPNPIIHAKAVKRRMGKKGGLHPCTVDRCKKTLCKACRTRCSNVDCNGWVCDDHTRECFVEGCDAGTMCDECFRLNGHKNGLCAVDTPAVVDPGADDVDS